MFISSLSFFGTLMIQKLLIHFRRKLVYFWINLKAFESSENNSKKPTELCLAIL